MTILFRPQFTLAKRSKALDRRVAPVRGDLADVALAGAVFVPHYARQITKSVIFSHASIYQKPEAVAMMVSELLQDEQFAVLDVVGEWAWGYCVHDHYVGYIRRAALGSATDVRTRDVDPDYVKAALSYVGVPYCWGGRSRDGIDCSGLVQVSLANAGVSAPRDADQQMSALGQEIPTHDTLQHGDLIFFPGHVGIMTNSTDMVHATGFHHQVIVEPLATVSTRIAEQHSQPIIGRKRLP